jgi:hypothetical protein
MKAPIAFAMLLAVAPAAFAAPSLEREMQTVLGKAFAKLLFGDQAEAQAECTAGKTLLTPKTPKYLAAYHEECLAVTAAPAGPGNETLQCPHYVKAIEIWRVSPPPMTGDEDAAIKRAGKLKSWKSFAVKHCGAAAGPARTDMGPITAIASGSRLRTQEGLSYVVPDGWTIRKFDDTEGFALLSHAGRNTDMRVARVSLKNKGDYAEKTPLPGGRTLEWKYIEFIPKSGMYVMYGRAKLEGAYVEFGVVPGTSAPSGSSVDKDFALETLKAIVASAKIEGKRACIGDCGPGTLAAPN